MQRKNDLAQIAQQEFATPSLWGGKTWEWLGYQHAAFFAKVDAAQQLATVVAKDVADKMGFSETAAFLGGGTSTTGPSYERSLLKFCYRMRSLLNSISCYRTGFLNLNSILQTRRPPVQRRRGNRDAERRVGRGGLGIQERVRANPLCRRDGRHHNRMRSLLNSICCYRITISIPFSNFADLPSSASTEIVMPSVASAEGVCSYTLLNTLHIGLFFWAPGLLIGYLCGTLVGKRGVSAAANDGGYRRF